MKRMAEDYDNGHNWEPTWPQYVRNWDAEQRSQKYYETKTCSKCHRRAVWFYGPYCQGEHAASGPYCEKHADRGCSCNTWEGVERLDHLGREWPCADWDWRPNAFWRWFERITHPFPWRKRKMSWSAPEVVEDYIIRKRIP